MNSRIENVSSGKYLYIETGLNEDDFEYRMAASVASESIIAPTKVFAYGSLCLEYCITGLKLFEEYLTEVSIKSNDIIRILAQTEECVRTVENYLLSENDLLIDTKYLYADAATGALRICIVPGYNGNFEEELKRLINSLLVHIDAEDETTLKLGYKLFKTIAREDYKLHDIIAVMNGTGAKTQAAPVLSAAAKETSGNVSGGSNVNSIYRYGDQAADLKEVSGAYGRVQDERGFYDAAGNIGAYAVKEDMSGEPGDPYAPQQNESGDFSAGFDRGSETYDEEEAGQGGTLKETLTGLAVSQAILIAVAIVVFLLKGRSTVMRLIPVYLVIAACVTVYYLLAFGLKRRKE